MYRINVKGSYFEMGKQYGRELKKLKFRIPRLPNKTKSLALKCRNHIESVFPEFLDELRGISETSDLNYDHLCTFTLVIPDIPACTIFAVNDGNFTWMGRNYDMYYSFKEHLESTLCEPLGGYKSIGHSDVIVGREDGINEKGLGVAQAGITAYVKPGLSFWVVIRYILDKCTTVNEAVCFITDIPHYCTISYLLSDKSGCLRIVEVGPNDRIAIRESTGDFLISTNHFNHPSMQNIKIYEPPDSRTRYNKIFNALNNRTEILSEEYFKKLLADHEGLVCSHRDEINLGTLWSVIYNLNNLQIWRAVGHPCSNQYREDKRLIKALEN